MNGGDPLKKVLPGDPVRIPAPAYNAFVDAARWHRTRRTVGPASGSLDLPPGAAWVRNAGATDLPRFGVVGLGGPLFPSSGDLAAFKAEDALTGQVPADASHRGGRLGIAREIIEAGAVGAVTVMGLAKCQVDFGAGPAYPRADLIDGDAAKLRAEPCGPIEILWSESTSGVSWALVRVGSGVGRPVLARLHTPTQLSANRWTYQAEIGEIDGAGAWSGSGVSVSALSMAEFLNGASGTLGSGVATATLPANFAHVPMGERLALLWGPYGTTASPVYLVEGESNVDGECAT